MGRKIHVTRGYWRDEVGQAGKISLCNEHEDVRLVALTGSRGPAVGSWAEQGGGGCGWYVGEIIA